MTNDTMSQKHRIKQIPGWLAAVILLPFVAYPLLRCWEVYHRDQPLSNPLHSWAVMVMFTTAIVVILGYGYLRHKPEATEANNEPPQSPPAADHLR